MRLLRLTLAVLALPVAVIAVVVIRRVPFGRFWSAYWADAADADAEDRADADAETKE